MNKLLRPISCCVLLAGLVAGIARGQDGNDLGTLPVARPFQAGVGFPMPGRVWIGGNAAHNGLGYTGSYFTGGFVSDLGQDALDGFWVLDARANLSQQGNLFGNFGFVRGISFEPLNSDLRVGFFYDVDGDKADNFGHTFHQLGVTGEFLHDFFEVRANGYFPIATTDYQLGTATECFVGNNFLVQPGIDSAPTGFDARVGFRPASLQPWAGVIDVGGYYYHSDIVEPFGGFTGGFSIQPVNGITGIFQINHDDQFKTTGLLGVQVHFGGSRNRGASRVSNEAVPVRRNEHIVRIHQDPVFATNPATGLRFNVIHVDNSAPAGGDGTRERPFNTLAQAEAASIANDMIFVREGLTPANLTGYNTGIVLKDGQFFLGDGVPHLVPTVEAGLFQLCSDLNGLRPTITNPVGPAVTLANNNTVAGFNIGNAANPAATGIFGAGVTNATIRDNVISNAQGDGVRILGATGVFEFTRNNISNSLGDGINVTDLGGIVNVSDSTFFQNGVGGAAGVHVSTTIAGPPSEVNVSNSFFSSNGTGILTEATGVGVSLTTRIFNNPEIIGSVTNGIEIRSADGADHNILIDNNAQISLNGLGGAGGQGIVLRALDGGAVTSILRGTVSRNTFVNNRGDGAAASTHILVDVTGNANTPALFIDSNSFVGGAILANGGPGLRFNYNVTGNALDNIVQIRSNIFTNINNDDAVRFDTAGVTRLGAIITNNVVNGAGGEGFDLRGSGDSVSHYQFTQNLIQGAILDGINASVVSPVAGDTPIMIVEVIGNTINNNGGVAINLELGQINGAPVANTDADLFAFIRNNTLTPNGAANDVTATIEITALATSSICMQMTNNNAADGILLTNNSLVADFDFENGGANVPAAPTTAGVGFIDVAAPAGTCAAAAGPVAILPLIP